MCTDHGPFSTLISFYHRNVTFSALISFHTSVMEHFVPWTHFTTVIWHFLPRYHFTTVMEHFLPWYHFTTVMWLFIPWNHFTAVIEHFLPWYHFTTVMWLVLPWYHSILLPRCDIFYLDFILLPSCNIFYLDTTLLPWWNIFLPRYHFTTVMWLFRPWYHFTTVIEHFLPWYSAGSRHWDKRGARSSRPLDKEGTGGVSPKNFFKWYWGWAGLPWAPLLDPPLLILFYYRDVTFFISLRVHRDRTLSTLVMISLPWCTRPFGCLAEHFYTVFVRPWSEFVFIVRRCLGCSHTGTLYFLFRDCPTRVWK